MIPDKLMRSLGLVAMLIATGCILLAMLISGLALALP